MENLYIFSWSVRGNKKFKYIQKSWEFGENIDAETEYLVAWLEQYLKNRDLLFRKIIAIQKEGNLVKVQEQDREIGYWVVSVLNNLQEIFSKLQQCTFCCLVAFHTKENFEFVLQHWEELANFKSQFRILFVNPLSQEKAWGIFPATHQVVTEKESLRQGLESIAASVPFLSKAERIQISHGKEESSSTH